MTTLSGLNSEPISSSSTTSMSSATLATLGLQIARLFKEIQNIETLSETGINLDRVTIEAERFQLWAVNVGLFTASNHSLGFHICNKEQGDIIATLQRFLKGLRRCLSDSESVPNTYYTSCTSEFDLTPSSPRVCF